MRRVTCMASCGSPADRPDDIASDQCQRNRNESADQQAPGQQSQRGTAKQRIDVIDVDPAADHPAPGFAALDVGNLRNFFLETRFRPDIIDKTGTLGLYHVAELDKDRFAVLVLELGKILAVQFRLDRVHDDDRIKVIDPEIFGIVITHVAHGFDGELLRVINTGLAIPGLLLVEAHRGLSNLDKIPDFFLAIRK